MRTINSSAVWISARLLAHVRKVPASSQSRPRHTMGKLAGSWAYPLNDASANSERRNPLAGISGVGRITRDGCGGAPVISATILRLQVTSTTFPPNTPALSVLAEGGQPVRPCSHITAPAQKVSRALRECISKGLQLRRRWSWRRMCLGGLTAGLATSAGPLLPAPPALR